MTMNRELPAGEDEPPCTKCYGARKVWRQRRVDGVTRASRETCDRCEGTGKEPLTE